MADTEIVENLDGETETEELTSSTEVSEVNLNARLSALLFVATRPLSATQLAQAANADEDEVVQALNELKLLYSGEINGFELVEVNSAYQFRTVRGATAAIQRLIPKKNRRLSRAAAETLAVVAYRQPVSRAEIESIRGVDALPTLKTLLDARLVRSIGRDDSVGHPTLYGTTPAFLEKFGLKDLSDLPSVRELEEIENDPGETAEAELA